MRELALGGCRNAPEADLSTSAVFSIVAQTEEFVSEREDSMTRRIRPFLVIVAGFWLFLQCAESLSAVAIGNRVQVTSVTNVRSCAGTSCSIITEAPVGSLGVVLAGPNSA